MTLQPRDLDLAERESLLGQASPLVKLGVAAAWLIALATTVDARPGLLLAFAALAAIPLMGAVPVGQLVRRLWPLVLAALGIAVTNLLFASANTDPTAAELLRLGPLRLTVPAATTALGLGARVLAIISVGSAFALTTDATGLADGLTQQAGLSPRFAYGALAAYQAVPRLAEDLATLRAARRLRGLRDWHPRILVGLLIRAIRHADQLALAMDARAFGTGPRTVYRPLRWGTADVIVGSAGILALVVAMVGIR
ncbi:MAG TPA: energy-coupling factor transporter transmembrane component T [Candidatus Limnocylindrales bacterium]|nr:energy-coupling factor transporter transmembrane component T [Candidatus Limnocylindrales bacterium]